MRNNIIVYLHAAIILWILSSLTKAEYSGSNDGFGKKSGFDSTYNGFLGEYAGRLGAGKALSELHDEFSESSQLPPEHGSQFDEGESHNFSESFGEQNDDGDEDGSHYDRYSGSFESLKFPQDVDAHHYSGGVSSDDGLGSNNHHHHHHHHNHHSQHHFENHNYQFDEPAKSSDYKGYHSFEGTQIVPYSGSDEAEQHEESQPKYSGYEHPDEENEVAKAPAKSYEAAPKTPTSSYSHSSEASKAPPVSYSHSYEDSKDSKAPPSSYSHFYENSKPTATSHSHSYDSSKIPASSTYSHSFESPSKTSSSSYESHKTPSLSHHEPSLGSYGSKYHQEAPSKLEVIHKYKSSGLKDFHSPLQKNIMTINHGKGGYSFSSLYRT